MHSLVGIDTVVASPVFDAKGEVSGVVYGVRQLGAAAECCGIRPLEAQLVQLLAAAVSAGWARLETEAEAARTGLTRTMPIALAVPRSPCWRHSLI